MGNLAQDSDTARGAESDLPPAQSDGRKPTDKEEPPPVLNTPAKSEVIAEPPAVVEGSSLHTSSSAALLSEPMEPVAAVEDTPPTIALLPGPPPVPEPPGDDPKSARRARLIARIDQLAESWDDARKDPLLKLMYQECWLRDRLAGLILVWRSRPARLREVAREREEHALRTFISVKPYVLRAARLSDHYRRGHPHPEQSSGPLEACIEAALLRSTRVVVADLVEQVLESPPSLEELAAP